MDCVGSLSHGTMRTQDLLPEFLDAIRDTAEYAQLIAQPFGVIPAHAIDDDLNEWWHSEDASFVVDELFDVLDSYAPDGYYFGAHPGDGSDYGFWVIEEGE